MLRRKRVVRSIVVRDGVAFARSDSNDAAMRFSIALIEADAFAVRRLSSPESRIFACEESQC